MQYRFGSLALLAVLAGGCVVDDASEDGLAGTAEDGAQEAVSDQGALGTASQELKPAGDVGWMQGNPALGLGPTSDRICFLAGMRGNFAGLTESVRVYPSNGSWWLHGASTKTGVGAWAACAFTPNNVSAEYTWTTSTGYPKHMGTATKRLCFITRVAGGFNSTGEWVHAYVSGGDWYLTGHTNGPDLEVRARCVAVDSYGPEMSWKSTEVSKLMDWSGPDVGTCALTRILGRFDSSADMVHCDYTASAWYLSGTSAANIVVAARARLF
jgi:hypothetical protein